MWNWRYRDKAAGQRPMGKSIERVLAANGEASQGKTPPEEPAGPLRSAPPSRFAPVKIVAGIAIILGLALAYWALSNTGALDDLLDGGAMQSRIAALGFWGPLGVICLMAAAIVLSPIPSAPIALAAGALYGHVWGTIYVLLGAEAGALIAFSIARLLGHEVLRRWFGERLKLGLLGSQNTLMWIVLVTRLLPFLSFDLVSYAAGLTPLATWRFAVATLAGIIPASFLLTHFGGEMVSADARRVVISVLVLGTLTIVPVIVKLNLNRRRKQH